MTSFDLIREEMHRMIGAEPPKREADMTTGDWMSWGFERFGEGVEKFAQTAFVDLPVGAYNLGMQMQPGAGIMEAAGVDLSLDREDFDVSGRGGILFGGGDALLGEEGAEDRARRQRQAEQYDIAEINVGEVGRGAFNAMGHLGGYLTPAGLPGKLIGTIGKSVTPRATAFVGNRLTGMATKLGVAETAKGAEVMARNGILFSSVVRKLAEGGLKGKTGKLLLEKAAQMPGMTAGFMAETFLRGGPVAGEVRGDSLEERTKQSLYAGVFSVGLWWAQRGANAVQSKILNGYAKTGQWNDKVATAFAALAGGSVESAGFTMMDVHNFWGPLWRVIENGDTEGISTTIGEYLGNAAFLSIMRGRRISTQRRMEPESEELKPQWIKDITGEPDPITKAVEGIVAEKAIGPRQPSAEPTAPRSLGETAAYRTVPQQTADAWDALWQSGWTSHAGQRGEGVFSLPGWRGKVKVQTSGIEVDVQGEGPAGGQVRVEVPADMARRLDPSYKGKTSKVFAGEEGIDAIERLVLINNADAARGRSIFSRRGMTETDKPGIWAIGTAGEEATFYRDTIRFRKTGDNKWISEKKETVEEIEQSIREEAEPLTQLVGDAISHTERFLASHMASSDTAKFAPEHSAIEAALRAAEHGNHTDPAIQELRALISDPAFIAGLDPRNIRSIAKELSSTAAGVGSADRSIERGVQAAEVERVREETELAAREKDVKDEEGRREREAKLQQREGPLQERTEAYLAERKGRYREAVGELGTRVQEEALKAKKAQPGEAEGKELEGLRAELEGLETKGRAAGKRELMDAMEEISETIRDLNREIAKAGRRGMKVVRGRLQAQREDLEGIRQDIRKEIGRITEKEFPGQKGAIHLPDVTGSLTNVVNAWSRGIIEAFGGKTMADPKARDVTRRHVAGRFGLLNKFKFRAAVRRYKADRQFKSEWLSNARYMMQKTANPRTGESYQEMVRRAKKEQPKLLQYLNDARQHLDELHKFLVDTGALGESKYIEDYLTQLWVRPNTTKSLKEWMGFKTEQMSAKKRVIPSYYVGEKMGLTPRYDKINEIIQVYETMVQVIEANRQLMMNQLKSEGTGPKKLAIRGGNDKPPEGYDDYIKIDHPAMRYYQGIDLTGKIAEAKRGTIWVHPDTVEPLKKVFDTTFRPGQFAHAVSLFNQLQKGIALSMSFFHHFTLIENIFNAAFAPLGYAGNTKESIKHAAKTLGTLTVSGTVGGLAFGPLGVIGGTVLGGTGLAFRGKRLLKGKAGSEALEDGLIIDAPEDASVGAINKVLDFFAEGKAVSPGRAGKTVLGASLGAVWAGPFGAGVGALASQKAPAKVFREAKRYLDKFLWGHIHTGMKVMTHHDLKAAILKEEITKAEKRGEILPEERITDIGREVAEWVNDAFGGQNWDLYWRTNRKAMQTARNVMLSPDWTASVIRMGSRLPSTIFTPLSKVAGTSQQFTKRATWGYWFGTALALTVYQSAVQQLLLQQRPEEEQQKIIDQQGSLSMFDNDYGKEYDILYKIDPDTGRKIYISPLKQAKELTRLISDPIKYFWQKASPLVHNVAAFSLRKDPVSEYPYPWDKKTELEGFASTIPERLKFIAGDYLPFSLQTETQFGMTLPKKTGMTPYRSIKEFEKQIHNFARYNADDALENITAIARATVNNNIDVVKMFKTALARQRGATHFVLWGEGIDKQSPEAIVEALKIMARLGVTELQARNSIIKSFERAVEKGVSKEEAAVIAGRVAEGLRGREGEARTIRQMQTALQKDRPPRYGAEAFPGDLPRTRVYKSPLDSILRLGREDFAESGFKDRRTLQEAADRAATYLLENWEEAAEETLPRNLAAQWGRLGIAERRSVLVRYFYRRRLLPQAKAEFRRMRTEKRELQRVGR